MIIERISILNFKNIAQAEMIFSKKMNCLFGNNGMGKTNLLDALYYLSFCKNYTGLPDSQLISHNQDFAVLQARYCFGETEEDIYCGIKRNQRKVFKRNKKEYERLSDHIGLLPLVMISPSDTDLIQGGSEGRRKFTDMVISQYDKEYLNALIRYNKALNQRNCLLKDKNTDHTLFEIWEEQLVLWGAIIYRKRTEFIRSFLPVFQDFYKVICQGGETVGLTYESQLHLEEPAQLLQEKRERDRLFGYTTCGIHKDDFGFTLNNYLVRKTGSQGQNKTYLIALKLAQFEFLAKTGPALPILLLDDVFDKLDENRVEQIVKLVAQPRFGQIFITDTNRKYLDEILLKADHDYKLFQVEGGEFKELEGDR